MKANIIDVYFDSQGISILRRIDRQQFLYKKTLRVISKLQLNLIFSTFSFQNDRARTIEATT